MSALLLLALLQSEPLTPEHDRFLSEQAHFLLSTREREAFAALGTTAERATFIEGFWSRHDRETHERRLARSDELYAPRGRYSERGRLHQLLGPPATRQRFGGARGEVVPIELWLYRGVASRYLPESFYVVFFRRSGAGDLRVWSPAADGLRALLPGAEPYALSDREALSRLRAVDPELALAAEALVPGAGAAESQSLIASLVGLGDLVELDRAAVGRVDAAASLRRLPARLLVSLWPDDVGVLEMHYALELDASAVSQLPWFEDAGRRRVSLRLLARAHGRGPARLWDDEVVLDQAAREPTFPEGTVLSFQGRQLHRDRHERLELLLLAGDAVASAEVPIAPSPFLASVASGGGAEPLPFGDAGRVLVPVSSRPVGGRSIGVAAPFVDTGEGDVEWTVWRDGVAQRRRDSEASAVAVLELDLAETPEAIRVRAVRGSESRELAFRTEAVGRPPVRVVARLRTDDEVRAHRLARALALAADGELSRAVRELPPEDGASHVVLARSLYRERRFAGLLASLSERARDCGEPDLFVLLAAAASALGRYEVSESHYEQALELAPDREGIREALERVRARLRRGEGVKDLDDSTPLP